MNEPNPPKASPDTFDGDAISRADQEFLASLADHPLARHPLYSVQPPPRPDYDGCTSIVEKQTAQEMCFPAALDWLLVNYAYYTGAFMGKGGIISLVDGEMCSIASLRSFMQPYTIVEEGPRGGLKKTSVVDTWMMHPQRAQIDKVQTRSDRPRPTYTEDGLTIFNRYWPPVHPTSGGDFKTFKTFFARLFPDEKERAWFWNYLTHKTRKPWIPMVGVIMVAEEFGSGRGTLFDILELLFGEDYVAPCTFGQLTGTSASARFNARLADALIAVVNEAVAEDGHLQAQRRLGYEALKNNIEPSPTARRPYEAKGQHTYAQRSAMSVLIATNHRDVIKLPRGDRRCCVLTCGSKMTVKETEEIRAWMAIPENIGVLYRALLETPAEPRDVFDPCGEPPPFEGRLKMIGMGETRLEDAYGAAVDALEGFPLFTMTQALRLIGYFGDYKTGDWSDKARHTVTKNAYRLRERNEPSNRIKYLKRDEIIYARTKADQQHWHPADTKMIIKQLDLTEKMIVRLVNTGQLDITARLEELRREQGKEDDDEN
jgi:hypothetical protein